MDIQRIKPDRGYEIRLNKLGIKLQQSPNKPICKYEHSGQRALVAYHPSINADEVF